MCYSKLHINQSGRPKNHTFFEQPFALFSQEDMMKKIVAVCALALASFALLSAQAQVPGFSNTVHAAVGQSVEKNAQIKFLGFTEYFTGNVTVGKITFTGDIAWQLIPGPGGVETRFGDHNINVVINPVIPHGSGSEAELMAECEKRIEAQQPLIEGKGPFAVAKVV